MARGSKTVAPTVESSHVGSEVAEQPRAGGQMVPGIAMASQEEMEELAGVGNAGVSDDVNDRGVPLLAIVQKGSPQLDKKKDEKFIEGAEFGDVFNNITKKVYKAEEEPIIVLPCFFRMVWKEWVSRDEGGGYRGAHPRDTPLLRDCKPFTHPETGKVRNDIMILPSGNELHQTVDYYCVLEETWQQIVIPMASTNLGASRTLQTLLDEQKLQIGELPGQVQFRPKPGYWSRVSLKTVYKDDGTYQWYQYSPSIVGPNESRALRDFCKAYAIAVARNEVKVSAPDGDGGAAKGDDIPG